MFVHLLVPAFIYFVSKLHEICHYWERGMCPIFYYIASSSAICDAIFFTVVIFYLSLFFCVHMSDERYLRRYQLFWKYELRDCVTLPSSRVFVGYQFFWKLKRSLIPRCYPKIEELTLYHIGDVLIVWKISKNLMEVEKISNSQM